MNGYAARVINSVQACDLLPYGVRRLLLRWLGVKLAPSSVVAAHVHLFGGYKLELAPNAFVNTGCYLNASERIVIGKGAHLAPNVMVFTASHHVGPSELRAAAPEARSVLIEGGCWIGGGAIILPGVTISRGCVIGAGAVVARSTEPDGLYLGNPARRVRTLGADATRSTTE